MEAKYWNGNEGRNIEVTYGKWREREKWRERIKNRDEQCKMET